MGGIDQDALQEMCDEVDLLEYASRTFEFKRKGEEYFTSCPLHSDSDPSLSINPTKNLFFCRSCHKGGNIINWMMTYEGKSFNEAVDGVSNLTGTDIKSLKSCDTLKFFKSLSRMKAKSDHEQIEREILPESYMDRFKKAAPIEWVEEGIDPMVMKEYEICIDESSNRICYPIYDVNDQLIGVKGRTRFKGFKEMKISKYMNYSKIKTMNSFVGLKQNRKEILSLGSVILFEGIKSGLKLSTWGFPNNWLSVETSRINEEQVKLLLSMRLKEITVAFDRDVDYKDIKKCTTMLRRFTNVYVVRDKYREKDRLLPGDKDSPVDAGKEVWETLYNERRKIN